MNILWRTKLICLLELILITHRNVKIINLKRETRVQLIIIIMELIIIKNKPGWEIRKMGSHTMLDLQSCHQISWLDSSKTLDQPTAKYIWMKTLLLRKTEFKIRDKYCKPQQGSSCQGRLGPLYQLDYEERISVSMKKKWKNINFIPFWRKIIFGESKQQNFISTLVFTLLFQAN